MISYLVISEEEDQFSPGLHNCKIILSEVSQSQLQGLGQDWTLLLTHCRYKELTERKYFQSAIDLINFSNFICDELHTHRECNDKLVQGSCSSVEPHSRYVSLQPQSQALTMQQLDFMQIKISLTNITLIISDIICRQLFTCRVQSHHCIDIWLLFQKHETFVSLMSILFKGCNKIPVETIVLH